jgi:hypothetical protein
MKKTPIKSGGIVAVGHDPATRTLEVEWSNGTVSKHLDVGEHQHKAMMSAEKPCSYWHSHIKNQHPDVNKK